MYSCPLVADADALTTGGPLPLWCGYMTAQIVLGASLVIGGVLSFEGGAQFVDEITQGAAGFFAPRQVRVAVARVDGRVQNPAIRAALCGDPAKAARGPCFPDAGWQVMHVLCSVFQRRILGL